MTGRVAVLVHTTTCGKVVILRKDVEKEIFFYAAARKLLIFY